jgi:hypothetical protein
MNKLKNLENSISDLKKSPLFHLFSSSKEQFHSNFWVWLSQLKKDEAIKLFSNKKINSPKFKREHTQKIKGTENAKIDLIVFQENGKKKKEQLIPLIVIENKVKDFPKEDQLIRIKKSFGNNSNNIEFILTTLFWKKELKDKIAKNWKIITYRDIADAIDSTNFTKNIYYKSLIDDYKRFTSKLAEISENLPLTKNYDFFQSVNQDLFKYLEDIQFLESYLKIRASDLLFQFDNITNHKDLEVDYLINRKKATINFFIKINNDYKIGITIEDKQYRKIIEGSKPDQFSKKLLEKEIFFNNDWKSPKDKKVLLGYEPKWKYQYEEINKIETYKDLFKKINNDINEIKKDFEKIKESIPSS